MKLIITGASGQFGRLVIQYLLEKCNPPDLILLSRTPEKLAEFAELGCDVRAADFDEPDGLLPAMQGGDRMLLISATRVGQRIPQHAAAIDAAKQAGVKHVIYTSFIGAGDPNNKSEAVKDHRGTEALMRDSGLAWTALRDAQYADAVTDVIVYSAVHDGVMLSVAGDGQMPFVWRADCAAAAAAVLTSDGHENKAYDITGPDLISFREVSQLIGQFTGQAVTLKLTDEAGLYAMFDALGVPREPIDDFVAGAVPWNSNDMVSFEVAVKDGCFAVQSDDFERITGRKPRSLLALFELKAEEIAANLKRASQQ